MESKVQHSQKELEMEAPNQILSMKISLFLSTKGLCSFDTSHGRKILRNTPSPVVYLIHMVLIPTSIFSGLVLIRLEVLFKDLCTRQNMFITLSTPHVTEG